jgi:hypothetical protein
MKKRTDTPTPKALLRSIENVVVLETQTISAAVISLLRITADDSDSDRCEETPKACCQALPRGKALRGERFQPCGAVKNSSEHQREALYDSILQQRSRQKD